MQDSKNNQTKKPWPTKKAMEQIYEQNLWGGNSKTYYSGSGSHDLQIVVPYINCVLDFLKSLPKPVIILDLGCGDFNIGQQILPYAKKYIAIDIAENVINYNKSKFIQENLEFLCLDIAKDALPKADVVIIRQVLQHLSNREVKMILSKLNAYKYILLTEHLPSRKFEPNKDIISGQGIRLKKQSGLCIIEEPFNFICEKEVELLSIELGDKKGVIKTWLYQQF